MARNAEAARRDTQETVSTVIRSTSPALRNSALLMSDASKLPKAPYAAPVLLASAETANIASKYKLLAPKNNARRTYRATKRLKVQDVVLALQDLLATGNTATGTRVLKNNALLRYDATRRLRVRDVELALQDTPEMENIATRLLSPASRSDVQPTSNVTKGLMVLYADLVLLDMWVMVNAASESIAAVPIRVSLV